MLLKKRKKGWTMRLALVVCAALVIGLLQATLCVGDEFSVQGDRPTSMDAGDDYPNREDDIVDDEVKTLGQGDQLLPGSEQQYGKAGEFGGVPQTGDAPGTTSDYVVVLRHGRRAGFGKHIKWLHSVSSDTSTPSHLQSNLTTIGKFAFYSGAFDDSILAQINASDVVAYIVPDIEFQTAENDRPPSWGLARIAQRKMPRNEEDYSYPSSGGEGVDVYIVDTGINLDHNDIKGRASFGVSFVDDQTDQGDPSGHGTFVAGIIGGNAYGIASKVNLISVKTLHQNGSGKLSVVLRAVEWVVQRHLASTNKKSIVNLSLVAPYNDATNAAIEEAIGVGVHFSIAAGNDGKDACDFSPASVIDAITVGAIDNNDKIANFSNTGSCVDIYAPGTNIRSIWNTGPDATRIMSGTSMASPHVAGVMAVLLSQGDYTPEELSTKIKELATKFSNTEEPRPGDSPNRLLFLQKNDSDARVMHVNELGHNDENKTDSTSGSIIGRLSCSRLATIAINVVIACAVQTIL